MNQILQDVIRDLRPGRLDDFEMGRNSALIEILQSVDISSFFGGVSASSSTDHSEFARRLRLEMRDYNCLASLTKLDRALIDEIEAEIKAERVLNAIKLFKAATGLNLAMSRDIIRKLE